MSAANMAQPTGSGFEATGRTKQDTKNTEEPLHDDESSPRIQGASTDFMSIVIDPQLAPSCVHTDRTEQSAPSCVQLKSGNCWTSYDHKCFPAPAARSLISRLLEDNERCQLSERTSVPTLLQAAYNDERQTNLESVLSVKCGKLLEKIQSLHGQLARVDHMVHTVLEPAASLVQDNTVLVPIKVTSRGTETTIQPGVSSNGNSLKFFASYLSSRKQSGNR